MTEERYIGSYKILQKIGAGGMAKVYLAVHEDVPNLKVILKVLDDPRLVARFKQEADKLALLDGHPNVCRIKHFFSHSDETVIAMEYIDGETLEEKIESRKQLPASEAIQIIAEVLDTLEFAHQKGIYHRDIKPGNIMLDSDGRVKIIDFGIAKGKADPNLTIAGTACGTPSYMAPEQFDDTTDADYALVDIYAVGTTLYYMLCGELPFKGDNQFAIRDAKLFSEPPKPTSIRGDIPTALEGAILKSINRDPKDRFQSAVAMKQAIQASGTKATDLEQRTGHVAIDRPRKKGKLGWIAAGVVAIALMSVIGYRMLQPSGPPVAPHLWAPWNETMIDNSNQPTFYWSATAGTGGTYELEYATDTLFADVEVIPGLSDTAYTPATGLDNSDYYWRVRAMADDGQMSPYSPVYIFTIELPVAEPATGTLAVAVNRRSDIYINDFLTKRNATRWESVTDTGTYILRIENSNSVEKVKHDTIHLGIDQKINRNYSFTLPQVRTQPTPPTGKLAVLSIPTGATVFVDGKLRDHQTPHTFTLPVGTRTIKVVFPDGSSTLESPVTIRKNREERIMFDLERDSVLFNL